MAVRSLGGIRANPLRDPISSGFHYSRSGFYRPERERLLLRNQPAQPPIQARTLAWLRDNIHPGIPRAYYTAVLGHDLHVSVWAELYIRHYHIDGGWWEDVGRVSQGKVTTAFRDFEALNLVTDSTTYGDFKWHEVGLSATAESNAHTGLQSTSGIARVAGTQTNPTASTYQTVATITADATETWQEHGLFNTGGVATMLDRSIISPVVNTIPGDTLETTYILTKNAEP